MDNYGDVVLFLQVAKDHYMAFHNGNIKHRYLDLHCMEALRNRKGGKLPRYHVADVLMSQTMAASPTQNPFKLDEGTEFTLLTARPLSIDPAGEGHYVRQRSTNKIQFYSAFCDGDIVLCFPYTKKRASTSIDGKVMNGEDTSSEGSARKHTTDYRALHEIPGQPIYTVARESVEAFRRKSSRRRVRPNFILGRVVMVTETSSRRFILTLEPM